ncbi:MAG: sugar ABC transporter substrate-binding protein [Steroidobacteraceae bacterium]|nr:sugar ABC transporter substrate-binding protein [Steroidobacteraceae bacterium]
MAISLDNRRLILCASALTALFLCAFGANAAPAAPTPQGASSNYIIGPGDTLQVFVWRNPDLSVTVPVRPDGRISTPLVQNMVAVGKTPAQLAHDMEAVLGKYLRAPTVNIIVTQPLGALSAVKVVGQVVHPEAVPYHEGMTVLDVVLQVGGLTEYAAGNRAKIIRKENGGTRVIHVELERLMNKGDMRQNLPIKPGDVLVVPESLF